MKKILFAILLILMAVVPATGFADPALFGSSNTSWIVGSWLGIVQHQGGPIVVKLTVDRVIPGQGSGLLRYGAPRTCRLNLEDSSQSPEQAVFTFTNSTGGYCDLLFGGTITAQKSGDGAIQVKIKDGAGKHEERTTLLKQ